MKQHPLTLAELCCRRRNKLHQLLCKPPATYTPDQIRRGSSETYSRRWL